MIIFTLMVPNRLKRTTIRTNKLSRCPPKIYASCRVTALSMVESRNTSHTRTQPSGQRWWSQSGEPLCCLYYRGIVSESKKTIVIILSLVDIFKLVYINYFASRIITKTQLIFPTPLDEILFISLSTLFSSIPVSFFSFFTYLKIIKGIVAK